MIHSKYPIYLASKSPRRRKMLKTLGIKFNVLDIEIEEVFNHNESPLKNVRRLALEKAIAAEKKIKNGIIITADTIVVLNGEIIGKPQNKKDAENILLKLSNRSHYVYTGFTLLNKNLNKQINGYSRTKVNFRKLDVKEIKDYIKTGSPMDKAGAYGIQDDFGAVFVKSIQGCYYNVLGFPASKIYEELKNIT
jgi:septum formation protein